MLRGLIFLALIATGPSALIARAGGPADPLLKLVPPEVGMTLTVEGLRHQTREILGSPLVVGLQALPLVRSSMASERVRTIQRAVQEIELAIKIPLPVIRDELIGDAVVLAFRPGPPDKPDDARGLLLALPRDRSLLGPMMARLNEIQTRSGELASVETRKLEGVEYSVRTFKPGGRLTEYHVLLDDRIFAWSNSEDLIHDVIVRNPPRVPGLGEDPAFRKVRDGLPAGSLVSLFLNPRFLERMIAADPRNNVHDPDRGTRMFARYLASVEYAGASLQWRDGFQIHTHESIDPARLDPWLKHWLSGPVVATSMASLVPDSVLAVVSAQINPQAIRDALWELVPEEDQPRMENFRLVLQGLLMGHDPNTEVLPRLGPSTLFYLEAGPTFPISAVIGWTDRPGLDDLAVPLENALRTILGLYALDPKHLSDHLRIETRTIGPVQVTSLTNGLKPLVCYRIDQGRLILGNSPENVARFGTGPSTSFATRTRAKYFPEASTFAIVDVGQVVDQVKNLRGPIASKLASGSRRAVVEVDRDLGHLLSVGELFGAITFTSSSSTGATEVHRSLGLIAR